MPSEAAALNFLVNSDPSAQLAGLLNGASGGQNSNPTFGEGCSYPFTLSVVVPGSTFGANYLQPGSTGNYDLVDISTAVQTGGVEIAVAPIPPGGLASPSTGVVAPTGGTFALTWGSSTQSGLAYNVTLAALETALQALATAASDGTITPVQMATGVFRATFATPGARSSTFTANSNLLQPVGSQCQATRILAGSADSNTACEIWEFVLQQGPFASATPTTPLPSFAPFTVTGGFPLTSPTVTLTSQLCQSVLGWAISGTSIPPNTTVLSQANIVSGGGAVVTVLTMSANSTALVTAETITLSGTTVSATRTLTGTSNPPAAESQRITLSPPPYSGVASWSFKRPEITSVGASSDTTDIQQILCTTVSGSPTVTALTTLGLSLLGYYASGTSIPVGAKVTGSISGNASITLSSNATATNTAPGVLLTFLGSTLNNTVGALVYDNQGPVEIYLTNGTAAINAPATPGGGRQIPITIPQVVVQTSGTTTSANSTITVVSSSGMLAGASIAGAGIPAAATITTVASSTSLVLSANASATASGVLVTATNTVSASSIAGLINTALTSDPYFGGYTSVSGSVVTITDPNSGARTAATATPPAPATGAGFLVSEVQAGCSLAATLPWNASATQIQSAFTVGGSPLWTASVTSPGVWDLVSTGTGTQSLITVGTGSLLVPTGCSGTLNFNTDALRSWFYPLGNTAALGLSISITYPGQAQQLILDIPCSVVRNPQAIPGSTGLAPIPGVQQVTTSIPNGQGFSTPVAVSFADLGFTSAPVYGGGYVTSTDSTPNSYPVGTIVNVTSSGATVYLTGDVTDSTNSLVTTWIP